MNKQPRRIISIVIVLVMLFSSVAPAYAAAYPVGNGAIVEISLGESKTLETSRGFLGFSWASSDTSVVKVSPRGVITGVGVGSAIVSVKGRSFMGLIFGYTRRQNFNVVVTEKKIDDSFELIIGEPFQIDYAKTNGKVFKWSSSDESVATVDQTGTVIGIGEGRAVIKLEMSSISVKRRFFGMLKKKITTTSIKTFEVSVIQENELTVSFDSLGGSIIDSQIVERGGLAEMPEDPKNDGLFFTGWYEEQIITDWTNVYDFNTPVNKSITLYAGWVDLETDSDNDGLSNDLESILGTDSNTDDSDGDGLSDYEERLVFAYDPNTMDTDKNGVSDGEEDYDGDGLSNLVEKSIGTNPTLVDSDHDSLDDYEEMNTYGTDPLQEDTDGDGASDGDEVRIGTDPLQFENSFTEVEALGDVSPALPVALEVTALLSGEQVGTMDVDFISLSEHPDLSAAIPGYLGQGFDLSVEGQPEEAELTFYYDSSLGTIGEDFQPRIYFYNEENGLLEELPDQEISDGVVKGKVQHFSSYILLNKIAFEEVWKKEIKMPDAENETEKDLNIAFVVDTSGSMNGKLETVREVIGEFISIMGENDKAAIITFSNASKVIHGFDSDKQSLLDSLQSLRASGGTSISGGIYEGIDEFANKESGDAEYNIIVLLTDGQDGNFNSRWKRCADECTKNSITVYSIGIGRGVDSSYLTYFAEATGGKYYYADSIDMLSDYFVEIKGETVDYTNDSNNDGISDYYSELIKRGELVLNNGSREFIGIDFNDNPDMDGDGLRNGDELRVRTYNGKVYLVMESDPTIPDTDSDGLADVLEYQYGTNRQGPTYMESMVSYPLDGNNFLYLDIYNEEMDSADIFARSVWSAVTFNWHRTDEAKEAIAKYFQDIASDEMMQKAAAGEKQEFVQNIGQQIIGGALKLLDDHKLVENTPELVSDIKELIVLSKQWFYSGQLADAFTSDPFRRLQLQLNDFNYKYSNDCLYTANEKLSDAVDTAGDWVSVVNFAIEEFEDVAEIGQTYAIMKSSADVYAENREILIGLSNCGTPYVEQAADEFLKLVDQEYVSFWMGYAGELSLVTGENAASLMLELASINPYVAIVKSAIGLIGVIGSLTGYDISCIEEGVYKLSVVNGIVDAEKKMVSYAAKPSGYCDISKGQIHYLKLLLVARSMGCGYGKTITNNQTFWGHKDNEARFEIAEAISGNEERISRYLEML